MNVLPRIGQIRCSIFISQFIGFTPENFDTFRTLLMPEGVATGVQVNGAVSPTPFYSQPQYGMPWSLSKNLQGQNDSEIISFLPGKIDFVLNKTGDIQELVMPYISRCENGFQSIISKLKSVEVNRLAFCPLHSIKIDEKSPADLYWGNILKRTSSNGIPCQNVEISYLLKNQERINGKDVSMNFLHQIKDGFHMINGQKDEDCILVVLDINTATENNLKFSAEDQHSFWNKCFEWEMDLLNNIF